MHEIHISETTINGEEMTQDGRTDNFDGIMIGKHYKYIRHGDEIHEILLLQIDLEPQQYEDNDHV